jgi:hypothetical protein
VQKRGNLTALSVVGSQQWRGFVVLGDKKLLRRKCTRNRADGGIKVVKCDGMREEDACGASSSRVGFTR